jgi:hypothetical protein
MRIFPECSSIPLGWGRMEDEQPNQGSSIFLIALNSENSRNSAFYLGLIIWNL